MRKAVNSITSDTFFFSNEEIEAKKTYGAGSGADVLRKDTTNQNSEKDAVEEDDPKSNMKKMGNKLVEQTDVLLKGMRPFFRNFNRHFSYVRLDTFIFQEADYMDVAIKEVAEITAIFASYDIFMNQLDNDYIPYAEARERQQ